MTNNTISVKILADSISADTNKRITTYEVEYPRYIHGEVMSHRLFSRNSSSSRAVPIPKAIDHIYDAPVQPQEYGANQAGMSSSILLTGIKLAVAQTTWTLGRKSASIVASTLHKAGLHKQWAGRVLEPYQLHKIVLTATEFDNFFHLRNHKDAQPEIQELARQMLQARKESTPVVLEAGEWHLPYITTVKDESGIKYYSVVEDKSVELTLEQAQQISASCCAQVSYRVLNMSLERAEKIFKQLVESKPVHASPFEHQATPMEYPTSDGFTMGWEEGITHMDNKNNLWSANFEGWIQYRQLIKDHVCWNYNEVLPRRN